MMNIKKTGYFILLSALVISCSDNKNTTYTDTSHLELPPRLTITEKPVIQAEEGQIEKTGLGKSVLLITSEKPAVMTIKKTFSRSWNIVEQALLLSEIKITDKNREQGVFYVTYDPDSHSKDASFFDSMSFFFFKDEFKEASYKLTIGWLDNSTKVRVQLIDSEKNDLLDDDGDDFDGSVDDGTKLVESLYKTIKDDLPI